MLIIIITFFNNAYSQTNNPRVSTVHTGTFSNNRISYVVGKIYVLPIPVLPKQDNVKEIEINSIKVYPNPVTNILTIETGDKSKIKFITISDMNGKIIFSNTIENNTIDLSFLKQEVYTLILDNDITKTFKIIKN